MSAETISREAASRINPIIGINFTEDTLGDASALLRAIGSMASSCNDDGASYSALYPLLSTIAAALDYEYANPRLSGAGAAKQAAAT